MKCTQPGCTGTIVDGYCDVCGMAAGDRAAPSASSPPPASRRRPRPAPTAAPLGGGLSASVTGSNRLGSVPLGSARSAAGSRPTRRLDRGGADVAPRRRPHPGAVGARSSIRARR